MSVSMFKIRVLCFFIQEDDFIIFSFFMLKRLIKFFFARIAPYQSKQISKSYLTYRQFLKNLMQSSNQQTIDLSLISTVICVTGNDGTGKSTICQYINQQLREHRPDIYCVERSLKVFPHQFSPLINEIKQLDTITFNYAFENERKTFKPSQQLHVEFNDGNGNLSSKTIKVFWFMLDLEPQNIRRRLLGRKVVDIYDSKKAVEYYSFIYRQFSWYYGIPIIYADDPTTIIISKMIQWIESHFYSMVSSMKFQQISLDFVNERNIENKISQFLEDSDQHLQSIFKLVQKDINCSNISQFYFSCPQFKEYWDTSEDIPEEEIQKFQVRLCSRWLIKNSSVKVLTDNVLELTFFSSVKQVNETIKIEGFESSVPYLKIYEEGESKILFSIHSSNPQVEKYFHGKVIILLKSTIYSHTKQHTGQIANLGQIRALGNILFLQMMRRNNLKHAYLCINHENGIILSQLVQTSQLQIVFKKQCLGTDKHSYHGINHIPQIVNPVDNCYSSGVYIRFDWRNPNHQLVKDSSAVINLDSYYYVVEKFFGKEKFFKLFLTRDKIKALGDKCISQDVVNQYAPTSRIKKNTLRVYSTFLYYSRKVGLEILDGCLMFDAEGEIVWSQINPDCMRVKSIKEKEDYDKDIWRYGGSSKKEDIVKKWNTFNKLFMDWFQANRFHQTQLLQLPQLCYPYQEICRGILHSGNKISAEYQCIYRELSSPRWYKQLIGTIDISAGKPTLVKSSQLSEFHSQQSLQQAYNYLSLMQDIVLVDIDAAIDKEATKKNNRSNIKQLVEKDRNKVLAVGGGIRTFQALDYYLNVVKCKKIILSSNLELLQLLKKEDIANRIIVELSINQHNQVLIKGRSINTQVNVITKISELITYGVKTISITFNHRQGHLNGIPCKQLVQLYSQIPWQIQNIIIAGGITTVDDLNFIWGFKRCIPQLGSAIWKRKLLVGDIYESLVKFNQNGLIVAIIVDANQKILGQVYLNADALKLTCETRKLHRYSREHQKVMKKGQTSSNVFDVIDLRLDCDNDSIIIKVKPQTQKEVIFCHKYQYSCFSQNVRKNQINALQNHILQRKQTGSGYTKRMMENEGLTAMKIIEEVQELHISESNKIHQAADLMAHLLIYLNAHNIPTSQILSELQRRSIDTIKIKQVTGQKKVQNLIQSDQSHSEEKTQMVGILGGKHFQRIDKLTENMIGIRLIRASNRSSKIDYEIVDRELYTKIFKNSKIQLVGIKSKDMTTIVAKNLVSSCLNYSIMMQNYPTVCKQVTKLPTPGIILALLGRKSEEIDPKSWSVKRKGIIVCEYPFSVNKYMRSLGLEEDCYTLIRVSGGTQSYLASQTFRVDFCDAIVESGRTVEDNDLRIVATLEHTIYTAYYEAL